MSVLKKMLKGSCDYSLTLLLYCNLPEILLKLINYFTLQNADSCELVTFKTVAVKMADRYI